MTEQIVSAALLGLGLSMDAFAVSVVKGLSVGRVRPRHMLLAGLWFGGFQALMPLIGYFLGTGFHKYIEKADHWVAFSLLLLIGANMLREAFSKEEPAPADASFGAGTMLLMALATSVDALAVGIALAMDAGTKIWLNVGIIGIVTFALSAAGIRIGAVFGERFRKKALPAMPSSTRK